ncbi:hypothetical protein [Kiritimatiella glycovorans]|uniref:Uncharacterized protein n=1 Tax=Kiritimatiella glycovorans TaxID=1307763 RepID=A0A0G3EHU4_9BACT|nr:hypothetical protein [Kiritimatiella glycovorans]AKJ63759.1 hypothetical protein L21SP4_00479 [Kiritimatiella glycovorans]
MPVQILMIVLFIALITVYRKRRRWPAANPVLIVLSVITLLLAGFYGWNTFRIEKYPSEEVKLRNRAAGRVVGEYLASSLEEAGPVLVIGYPAKLEKNPARELALLRLEELRAALSGRPNPVVISEMPYERFMKWMPEAPGPGYPRDVFFMQLEAHPDAEAVVSLLGVPMLKAEDEPKDIPPVYDLSLSSTFGYQPLFKHGFLKAAVTFRGRGERETEPAEGDSLGRVFRNHYLLVTPENYSNAIPDMM